jgi:uncharacterized protein (TIGR02328 family)
MRFWHQKLLPYLDRQRLLSQHRECCALRGKGWGKKHATVDYVFTHNPAYLVAYHVLVMDEMKRRGYHPDEQWCFADWRGSTLGMEPAWADVDIAEDQLYYTEKFGQMIYPEHNDTYLAECVRLLKEKNAPIDWEKVEQDLCIKV